MLLDISFIGAASYRNEGYARIYNSIRKHRRRSICVEDSNANNLLKEHDQDRLNKINKQALGLNSSLRYYKHERKTESNSGRYRQQYSRRAEIYDSVDLYKKLHHWNDSMYERRSCCKHNSSMMMNRVSGRGHTVTNWVSMYFMTKNQLTLCIPHNF